MEGEGEVPAGQAKRPNKLHASGNLVLLIFDCQFVEIWVARAVSSKFKSGPSEFQNLVSCQVGSCATQILPEVKLKKARHFIESVLISKPQRFQLCA